MIIFFPALPGANRAAIARSGTLPPPTVATVAAIIPPPTIAIPQALNRPPVVIPPPTIVTPTVVGAPVVNFSPFFKPYQ